MVHARCEPCLSTLVTPNFHLIYHIALRGWTSPVCLVHHERSTTTHWRTACPPAMASGLTDSVWTFGEFLWDTVAPTPRIPPTRRGPRPTHTTLHTGSGILPRQSSPVRPVIRLHKGGLPNHCFVILLANAKYVLTLSVKSRSI